MFIRNNEKNVTFKSPFIVVASVQNFKITKKLNKRVCLTLGFQPIIHLYDFPENTKQ